MDVVVGLDFSLFRWINQFWVHPILDPIMILLSNRLFWIINGVILVSYTIFSKNKKLLSLCLLIFFAILISDHFCHAFLKPTFGRLRPCYQMGDVRLIAGGCGSEFGFPSNHAANGMAVAMVTVLLLRNRFAWAMISMAVLVGLTRIYLGVHFPGDVLFGFLVGGTIGCVVYWALLPVIKRIKFLHTT